ncbi:MAG TPA: amino acid adenylation domain-containing protein [Acidimicrobiia bacterium]|nr:amino acid adenylation domain-containing protein [Acidimicrobiia bacterium]
MTRDPRPIVPVARGGELPLSFAQQRIWLLDQLEPISWTYNVSVVRRLHGRLRVDALRHALDELVARHEVLRTGFPTVDGRPVQLIGPERPCDLRVVDLSRRAHADTEARRRVRIECRRRFDLATGRVFRALVVRVREEEWILALTMHHIATDAWSESLMLDEISMQYDAFVRDEPRSERAAPEIQYADYAVWQRQADATTARHVDYWVHALDGMPPLLEVPGDRPRPHRRSGRGAQVGVELSPELTTGVRRVARAGRATPFMVLLAAYQLLLGRYTGQDDIVVGTPIANRTRRETNDLLGFFANTVALRADLSGEPAFVDVLARVRATALVAYSHQDAPFEQVVQALAPMRSLGHTALFQQLFVFQNAPARDLRFEGVTSEVLDIETGTSMFDLSMELQESGATIAGTLEYATDLYDRGTAERIVRHFLVLLAAIVADPAAPVHSYDLLERQERHRMLVSWNETRAPFPARTIHEQFATAAAAHADAIALTALDESVTYGELDARANQLAHHLVVHGVGPESRVGIHLPRSVDAIVTLLATLKAGGAYVPLDPAYPEPRLRLMIEDADVDLVVTRSGAELPSGGAHVVRLEHDAASIEKEPASAPAVTTAPDALAFVIYTSGSTGSPKGVMIEHRNVLARLFGVDYVDFGAIDAMLHLAPLAFDAATFEIWGALLHGSRLVIAPDEPFSLARFGSLVRGERVDAVCLTPALFHLVVDESWRDLVGVRQLAVGGDVLSPAHAKEALRLLPDLRLVNGYGPTEATTDAVCHDVRPFDAEGATIPIGRPIANTDVYIVDAHDQPVPVGVVGELLIGGAGLARGYLHRPELTAERFVPHPFRADPGARVYRTGDRARFRVDGTIEFVGRVDAQVKIRGFRVEPGEVEALLLEHPAVSAAAVVATDGAEARGRRLIAYVVADGTSARELRDHLRERVPAHLVPATVVPVDGLPMTSTGKLDRGALPAVIDLTDGVTDDDSMTPVERAQAAIWCEVLGLERVGIDDNFFALGGDSLLAAVLFARTARQTGRDIPLALMFASPTIREISRAIERHAVDDTTIVPMQPLGGRRPLVVGHTVGGLLFRYTGLVRHLASDQPVFGLRPTAEVLGGRRRLRLEELARRYRDDVLRLQPEGPYQLAGFCFGGIVMIEVAHQLEALGHTVAALALFDADPTDLVKDSRPRREAAQLAALMRGEETTGTYLRRRLTNARTRVDARPRLGDYVRVRRPGDAEPEWPLERALGRALKSYVVPVIGCPLTFFRAGDPSASTSAVRFVDGAERTYLVDGPGVSHDTLMDEPHVGVLASALTDVLDRSDLVHDDGRGSVGDRKRGGVVDIEIEAVQVPPR